MSALKSAPYTKDELMRLAVDAPPTRGEACPKCGIAIFAVTNQTSWRTFMYWRGQLQLKTPRGWQEDENTWVGGGEITDALRPKDGAKIEFPVPNGGRTWRCSVKILNITYSEKLSLKLQDRLRRAGLHLESFYPIWSTEIAG